MVDPGPGVGGEDDGLTRHGRSEETSVPELLKSVLGSGETGVLTFRRNDVTKSVHLHMGRVVYARSGDPDERLGEDLLLRGKISVRQYLEASRLIAPGRRLGTILVELGALEPEDLLGAIVHHVKEVLLDVFTWSTGEYGLVVTQPGHDGVVADGLGDHRATSPEIPVPGRDRTTLPGRGGRGHATAASGEEPTRMTWQT